MANYYSVVQYVPDDVRGERINVGVVVFGSGRTLIHFVDSWHRVRQFAPVDVVRGLKDFARHAKDMDESALRLAAERWTYGIQFTEPSGSLLSDDSLLYDAVSKFLIDPPQSEARGYRVKSDVAKHARRRVREVLTDRFGGIGRILLKEDHPIVGIHGLHPFDLAVGNGHNYFAAEAVSFQIPDHKKASKDAGAAAWAIESVRAMMPQFKMAVVVAKPRDLNLEAYVSATRAFMDLGAEIVDEDHVLSWAKSATENIPMPKS